MTDDTKCDNRIRDIVDNSPPLTDQQINQIVAIITGQPC